MSVKDFFKSLGKKKSCKDDFKSEYQQSFINPKDSKFEVYVEAWKRYHITANQIDGGHQPTNARQRQFQVQAMQEGEKALNSFLNDHCLSKPTDQAGLKMWNSAKLEALRRYGR